MAENSKKSKLKCQARMDDALASTGMPIAEGMTAPMDNHECPHGLVYDTSSVESDTGCSSAGCSNVNNETELGYSIVDEKDEPTKSQSSSHLDKERISYHFQSVCVKYTTCCKCTRRRNLLFLSRNILRISRLEVKLYL